MHASIEEDDPVIEQEMVNYRDRLSWKGARELWIGVDPIGSTIT